MTDLGDGMHRREKHLGLYQRTLSKANIILANWNANIKESIVSQ